MSFCQRSECRRMLPLLAGVALLFALLWAPRVGATIVSTSQQLLASGSTTKTLTFNDFDTNLGTLLYVSINVSASASGQASVLVSCPPNGAPCSRTESFSMSQTLQAFSEGSINLSDSGSDSTTITCTADPGTSKNCHDTLTTSVFGIDSAQDASTLDLFDNPGTFTLTFQFSHSASLFASQSIRGTVTYRYDDTPPLGVPEPGTLATVGLALAVMAGGAAARRRRTLSAQAL